MPTSPPGVRLAIDGRAIGAGGARSAATTVSVKSTARFIDGSHMS
jgi:hypothetical protein